MPIFVVQINLEFTEIPEKLHEDLAKFIANLYGKDINRVRILVHADQAMCINGSEDPCCLATYTSVAKYNTEQRSEYGKAITNYLSKILQIPTPRIFLQFYENPADMIAVNGQVFSDK